MNRVLALWFLTLAMQASYARTRVDFDHATRFSSYKTYRWVDSVTPPEALFPNQLMQERIIGFIDEALTARGLKRVKSGGDLLVNYRIYVTEQPVFTTFGDGWGCCWNGGWGSGISTTTVQYFYEGTLIVDMVDQNRKQLVFQGASTHQISSRPGRNARRLARAVNEVFEKYPPQP
ncbi:MAG TPA: DUF4136 domain-containing protein [Bryobacteraceae bacterium]|nr:DUF4136 domain-containing protein [Bryobacteraceae bacterium]